MAGGLADKIADTGIVPPVPASMIAPEDAYIPVDAQGMGSDLDSLTNSVKKNMTGLFPQIATAEKQKADVAKTQALGEAKQLGDYRSQLADVLKENKPAPVDIGKPPAQPDNNSIKQFGSLASMLGVFASAFTKKPALNALNASAAAMNAQRAGDQDAYKEAYQQWKDNTELALKKHKVEMENLHDILELSKEDQSAALAQLKAYGVAQSSDAAGVLAQLGDWGEIGKWAHSMETAGKGLASLTGQLFSEEVQDFVKTHGRAPNVDEKLALKKKAEGKDTSLSDDVYNEKYKDDPAILQAARAYHSGATWQQVAPGWGKDNPKREATERKVAELWPDFNWTDAHTKMLGEQSGQRSLATQTKKIELASNMLEQSLPSMMDIAKKVGLGASTDINALYNTAKRHLSDQDFSNFSTQLRAVTSDYSQFIGRGRLTVHSDQEALRILNEDMGVTSLQGFVDAVNTEKSNVQRAIEITKEGKTEKADEKPANDLPDSAKSKLKKGVHTTFGNGQTWTLDDSDKPQQVK